MGKTTSKKKIRVAGVVPLTPPLMDTIGCAAYICRSPSKVIQQRQEDGARIQLGYEPEGPRWHRIGAQIVYFKADVDKWLQAHAEPFGKTTRGRKPSTSAVTEPTP